MVVQEQVSVQTVQIEDLYIFLHKQIKLVYIQLVLVLLALMEVDMEHLQYL